MYSIVSQRDLDFRSGRIRRPQASKLVLIFDQFEELLTLTSNGAKAKDSIESQKRILNAIVGLQQDKTISHIRLLFVFREDYRAKFDRLFY